MDVSLNPVSETIGTTLYRLLLHPHEASLEGELLYCEDDELRFREKGLDIQDFTPVSIDIHQYVFKESNGSPLFEEQAKTPQLQVFIYAFSYLLDPTWLVNWENGQNVDEWFEKEVVRINEQPKHLELEIGEYLNGALIEIVDHHTEGVKGLRIVSFTTNKHRKLTTTKSVIPVKSKAYKLELPEGFGIIGRYPSPRYSFGFYISWMIPPRWTIQTHVWFPHLFQERIRSLLLTFHRLGKIQCENTGENQNFPFNALECILQWMRKFEFSQFQTKLDISNTNLVEEY